MGEGSLHPHPKGWGIRDPLHSRCIKSVSEASELYPIFARGHFNPKKKNNNFSIQYGIVAVLLNVADYYLAIYHALLYQDRA